MQEKPLVTIVTITLDLLKAGREKYFRQNLKSVHDQTYKNIEHIIIDGASTDGTVDLIKEYADKGWIKYISEPDTGLYDAMNKGIRLAKGKYVAFLNSDDFYHNLNAVKLSVEALEREQADFSYAGYLTLDDKEEKQIVGGAVETFIYTMPFGHPTMFTKTSVLRAVNGFNESYKVAADYDLIIRMILRDCKGAYLNTDIVSYRLGGICCMQDYSGEIEQIYLDNYSAFYEFTSREQAKNIMYQLKIPKDFSRKFLKYAIEKNIKNINVGAIMEDLGNRVANYQKLDEANKLSDEDSIPVFLSSDDVYAPFVATAICSILDHTHSFINFYILDGGISISNKEIIESLKRIYHNFSIEFIRIDTKKNFPDLPTRLHFSIDMYTRFLIPQLKPGLKKVIYSDVDVIFNDDIKKLYIEKLDGKIIGAVPYTFGYINPNKTEINSFHERLGLSDDHKYFESGLLLIDTELWRIENITSKLIGKAKKGKGVILTPDQDVFNMVFENNYHQLDNRYIVVPHRKIIMAVHAKTKKSVENPFIYHFAGTKKPWDDPGLEYAQYFWKYARMTPFYKELIYQLLKKGNKDEDLEKIYLKIPSPKIIFREYFCKPYKYIISVFTVVTGKIKQKTLEVLSPRNATLFLKATSKRCWRMFWSGPLRQPARKIWFGVRFKKIE